MLIGMHVHTTVFACSDAHSLAELGRVRTRFQERVETREQLVRALQRGACAPEPAGGDLARAALGHSLPGANPPPPGETNTTAEGLE